MVIDDAKYHMPEKPTMPDAMLEETYDAMMIIRKGII
jgi:hypothetical protein